MKLRVGVLQAGIHVKHGLDESDFGKVGKVAKKAKKGLKEFDIGNEGYVNPDALTNIKCSRTNITSGLEYHVKEIPD